MKAQREVSHLLRIALETQRQAAVLSAGGNASYDMLQTINGYIQGLHRAVGEIATLAGDTVDDIEELEAQIRREVLGPAQG